MYCNVTKALLAPQVCSTAPLVVFFCTAIPCVSAVFYSGHCVPAQSCGSYVVWLGAGRFKYVSAALSRPLSAGCILPSVYKTKGGRLTRGNVLYKLKVGWQYCLLNSCSLKDKKKSLRISRSVASGVVVTVAGREELAVEEHVSKQIM